MTPEDANGDTVRAALARGDLLTAYDQAKRAKALRHLGLDYLEVLTLAPPLSGAGAKACQACPRRDSISLATQAEALVILGDMAGASAALVAAAAAEDADVGARSTTLLQRPRLRAAADDAPGVKSLLD